MATEDVVDRLLISVACGIGVASEEVENVKVQILAMAKERGLLVNDHDVEVAERPMIEIETVPVRQPSRFGMLLRSCAVATLSAALAALFISQMAPASAEQNYLMNGPKVVTRVQKFPDGKYYVLSVKHGPPGVPFSWITTMREIAKDEVDDELRKIQMALVNG